MAAPPLSDKDRTVLEFAKNRRLAHAVLFKHRHPAESPAFHYEMIDLIHSDVPSVLFLAFRGSAKSTLQEEATIIQACLGEFKNKVILGSTRDRAIDRLRAIKYELEYNETIQFLFGDMVGPTWNEDRVVLANGICIQAFGPGQSFRGVKHLEWRPDRLDIDDLEDEESIKDVDTRQALRSWLRRVVFPALAPVSVRRVYATPLDPDALPMHLQRSDQWVCRTYPIYRIAPEGGREATWPSFYPLSWIEEKEREYKEDGAMQEFAQEYLCIPEDPATKTFTETMLKVEPRIRTWHSVYAAYDPARSKGLRSATTGYVVFSWIGRRLVIWRGGAQQWLPDEIIDDIMHVNGEYRPVEIGVETAGLVEFISQPLRQRALAAGTILPIRELKPPKGQTEFIRSLQPFFRAGEVEWASPIDPEARAQLLAFPTGRRDFPNALAYALIMRPGEPVFDGFGNANIVEDLSVSLGDSLFLAASATPQYTAGALVQVVHGGLRVLRDYVKEGGPGDNFGDIVRAASMDASASVKVRCPPHHFSDYDTIGLRAAAGGVPADIRPAGEILRGRELIRKLMTQERKGFSQVLVSAQARWTLNALAGGFARRFEKRGMLTDEPADGPYKVLMEGIESLMAVTGQLGEQDEVRYAETETGRRYITTLPTGKRDQPSKEHWWE